MLARRPVKNILAVFLLLAFAGLRQPLKASTGPAGRVGVEGQSQRVESSSGRFVAVGPPSPTPLRFNTETENDPTQRIIQLTPPVAVSAAEKVQRTVESILREPIDWPCVVHIRLDDRLPDPDAVFIGPPVRLGRNHFYVRMSTSVRRGAFIRTMVSVLLSSLAYPGGQVSEIDLPHWLIEGLSEAIVEAIPQEIVPERLNFLSSQSSWTQLKPDERVLNIGSFWIRVVREFRQAPPLSFTELSFPSEEALRGRNQVHYRLSAFLFLDRLLQLPNGPKRLLFMIKELGHVHNWQTAFLSAFAPFFRSALDVEKWWAISSSTFVSNMIIGAEDTEAALFRLDQALTIVLMERINANELPVRRQIGPIEAVERLGDRELEVVLAGIEKRLQAVAVQTPPPVKSIIAGYLEAIRMYRASRLAASHAGVLPFSYRTWEAARARAVLAERFQELERRRQQIAEKLKDRTQAG